MLGTFYVEGIGVRPENIEAEKWYILSGNKNPLTVTWQNSRDMWKPGCQHKELVEAQKRAEDWRPQSNSRKTPG